ncbi:DUF4862 family protein [bacterium]|nr:DUF4862 family protein [bacterium]
MKYIVGAYVTSPCLYSWNEKLEKEFYEGIKSLKQVRGLEHPFWGSLHPFDEKWFLNNLSAEWDIVLSCIPGTMNRMADDKHFGLASNSKPGRQNALNFMCEAQKSVEKINSHLNRQAVIAIQIVSAPNRNAVGVSVSGKAFCESLEELCAWDWQGAALIVEHCDAFLGGQEPEKGFLTLKEEIDALHKVRKKHINMDLGIVINWGRSAIECRSEKGPINHIKEAKKANLLKAIMFSGCTDKESPYGIWKDTHMPPPQEFNNEFYAQFSLMTAEQIHNCLQIGDINNLEYFGIKVMALPEPVSMERRIGLNRDTLHLLDKVMEKL